jgi:predicted nucleic acid-binding protein
MGENKIYDTSAVIEIIKRGTRQRIAFISVLTAVEYPPALHYAEVVLYPTKKDYALAIAWQTELRIREVLLPATDLIIAAQAVNNDMILVTMDKHFKILRDLVAKDLKLETL